MLKVRGRGVLLIFLGGWGATSKLDITKFTTFNVNFASLLWTKTSCKNKGYLTKNLFLLKITATAVVTHLRDNYNTENYPRQTCWKISMYPSQPHIHMLPILGTTFYFLFLISTPGKCTWNLVSFLNSQILSILDSDVFSYYSSRLSMKRGCFSP